MKDNPKNLELTNPLDGWPSSPPKGHHCGCLSWPMDDQVIVKPTTEVPAIDAFSYGKQTIYCPFFSHLAIQSSEDLVHLNADLV